MYGMAFDRDQCMEMVFDKGQCMAHDVVPPGRRGRSRGSNGVRVGRWYFIGINVWDGIR